MSKQYSTHWKASKSPRKQRNYVSLAPDHIRGNFVRSHLSKELQKKYGKRNLRVREGDKVKVLRGQFKGKEGKIESVDTKKAKVLITGIEVIKKEGSKTRYPIATSNLIIIELNLFDKRRIKKKEMKKEKEAPKVEPKKEEQIIKK